MRSGYTYMSERLYSVNEDGDVQIVSKHNPPEWTELELVGRVLLGGGGAIKSYHSFHNLIQIDGLTLVGSGVGGGSVGGGSGGGSVGGGSVGGGSVPANPAKVLIEEHKRLIG